MCERGEAYSTENTIDELLFTVRQTGEFLRLGKSIFFALGFIFKKTQVKFQI